MESTKPKMEYRFLGNSGLKVSVIGYGNWLNSDKSDNQKQTTQAIKHALSLGINFFDTAEAYGLGEAERQMGNAFKELGVVREDVVVSTKIFRGAKTDVPNRVGLSAKRVKEGLRASLKRLQLDYVDVVFAHRPDTDTPMEEICRSFDSVIRDGLAFYWGTSEWSAAQIVWAIETCDKLGLVKPITEQPQYNMLARNRFENEYGIVFDEFQYGSTIWSPLCGGILTGKYNDGVVPEGSRFSWVEMPLLKGQLQKMFGVDKEKTIKMFQELQTVAKELSTNLATLAMAWAIQNKDVSVAITGVSKPEQLNDSVNAVQLYHKITPELEQRLEQILGTKPDFGLNYKTWTPNPSRARK